MSDKPEKEKEWLCLACSQVMELSDEEPVYACPHCGDEGIPAEWSVRPEFKITWHELRCLIMWAEFWASQADQRAEDAQKSGDPERIAMAGRGNMRKIVYGIADRLHAQHMDGPPLTFSQELADVRAEYGAVEQNVIKED
ncbi:hypothetical protein KGP36_08135 [Patescibacteria group bacterium]|nr:hypothetical protein [Patescibacteria group bacterium]